MKREVVTPTPEEIAQEQKEDEDNALLTTTTNNNSRGAGSGGKKRKFNPNKKIKKIIKRDPDAAVDFKFFYVS